MTNQKSIKNLFTLVSQGKTEQAIRLKNRIIANFSIHNDDEWIFKTKTKITSDNFTFTIRVYFVDDPRYDSDYEYGWDTIYYFKFKPDLSFTISSNISKKDEIELKYLKKIINNWLKNKFGEDIEYHFITS